ncbi:DUF4306 domain-containing protein [Ureibacillus acetophenoni]|uniref:Uncharacterized protein DUF4306 n=1 Tax=Ureibacillus acetophenoni TaxID=614649 RepID=A0A285UD81_9BACL|nr:DUF4306 domain-containing protein [Ureibacillus acetophenoni]SOC39830.1 uncharacterized protein DUF4306 [Ureibacillus acetophenoni]
MFKYLLQIMISGVVLLFSTVAAWYEGSAIVENSLEWDYSTPFTHLLGTEILTGKEIFVFDYFVYAIKFQPFFPMIILICLLYMASLTLILVGKRNINQGMLLAFVIGLLCLGASSMFYDATTLGGSLFFYTLLLSAVLTILISMFFFLKNKHKQQNTEISDI